MLLNPRKQQINTVKSVSKFELTSLGIPQNNFGIVDTLDQLKENPPNIIVADCVKSVRFLQNNFKVQELHKKSTYIMNIGAYEHLHYDKRIGETLLKPSNIQFKKILKRYNGQDLDNKTLLVFRTGGIGDLLFIQPNLIYLKNKYPTCTIKFACAPQYQSMVEEWKDCVDEVLDLPFPVSEMLQSDYQAIFEGVIERCKEAESINSYNLFSKWLGLDLPNELLIPKQKPNNDCVNKCKNILKDLNIVENEFILIQMRASSQIRTPRFSFWSNLINNLTNKGFKILLTDLPEKSLDVDLFISKLEKSEMVKNFSKFSEKISDTIAMTSLARMVVSVDSALIHIAASLGIKSFGIFGSFPGEIRLSTYQNSQWVNAIKDCAPCFKHEKHLCKNSFAGFVTCFDNINIEETCEKIKRMYNV